MKSVNVAGRILLAVHHLLHSPAGGIVQPYCECEASMSEVLRVKRHVRVVMSDVCHTLHGKAVDLKSPQPAGRPSSGFS